MNVRTKIAAAGIGGAAATALLTFGAGPAAAAGTQHHAHDQGGHDHAVFVEANDVNGNSIAVYDRNPDGTLTSAGRYATGGRGGVLAGSVVDHLASQGALALDRDAGLLYAVNAGSDSVTVFAVHGDRLVRRQLIGSGGSFPVSVAVRGALVYVLDARD